MEQRHYDERNRAEQSEVAAPTWDPKLEELPEEEPSLDIKVEEPPHEVIDITEEAPNMEEQLTDDDSVLEPACKVARHDPYLE